MLSGSTLAASVAATKGAAVMAAAAAEARLTALMVMIVGTVARVTVGGGPAARIASISIS